MKKSISKLSKIQTGVVVFVTLLSMIYLLVMFEILYLFFFSFMTNVE